jgi:hypothetical protein
VKTFTKKDLESILELPEVRSLGLDSEEDRARLLAILARELDGKLNGGAPRGAAKKTGLVRGTGPSLRDGG